MGHVVNSSSGFNTFAEKNVSSFCTAKATHIFFSKKFQHICVSLNVNFNESLSNDVISFEQLGPEFYQYLQSKQVNSGTDTIRPTSSTRFKGKDRQIQLSSHKMNRW